MQLVHAILIACASGLLVWAVVRCRHVSGVPSDRILRRDTAVLFALALVGAIGDAVRDRFPDISAPYLGISLALVPVAIGAVVLTVRIARLYRAARATADPPMPGANPREPRA